MGSLIKLLLIGDSGTSRVVSNRSRERESGNDWDAPGVVWEFAMGILGAEIGGTDTDHPTRCR